jgi:hypothetical protein
VNRPSFLLIVLAAGALALAGCGSEKGADPVPTKDDFAKKPKPEGYRGPGEPGGPPSGAPAPPPATTGN